MNTFGENLRLTTFGESHGPAMGGVLDGFPSGVPVDFGMIEEAIAERRPGNSPLATQRRETDLPEWLSGISPDGVSLGTPIAWIVRNSDTRPGDYDAMKDLYRPGHADYTWQAKYGIRDHRGGGRASARETVSRVIGGALAAQTPAMASIGIDARLVAVGNVSGELPLLLEEIDRAKRDLDSVGGVVECTIDGVPLGLGDPVFGKLNSMLGEAMFSIPAVRCVEFGQGALSSTLRGSQSMDIFNPAPNGEPLTTATNNCGGIQGGISNGMPIVVRVFFHATPTIGRELPTVNVHGERVTLSARGRHDPCVALRGTAVVKAMARLVIADTLLRHTSPHR